MLNNLRNRTLTLAGVYQACAMVRDIANNGHDLNIVVQSTINTLFKTEPDTVEDVYGGLAGVSSGLRVLVKQIGFESNEKRDLEVTRYALALLYLERRLVKKTDLMNILSDGINAAQGQADYFDSVTHENVIARLGDLYQNTVSTLSPRIMVSGQQAIHQSSSANLIRTLLLAGMRSAILWRQCGGRRLQLLFGRKKIVNCAKDLLQESFVD